jgi:hypothetical protein
MLLLEILGIAVGLVALLAFVIWFLVRPPDPSPELAEDLPKATPIIDVS